MPALDGKQLMIEAMMKLGATEDEIVGMMLLLKTKEQRKEMILWLYRNRTATPQEMIRACLDIQAKTN